jgi:catechol 2,3-dioxygenase-like lactoylglutathione lyase family enzyme
MVQEHYDATLDFYGEVLGARVIRKHLGWYMDRAGTPGDLRRCVLTGTPATVRSALPDALLPEQVAA